MATGKYDDIIHLPHKQSDRRPHMSLYNRAAQFSPFAALTGYNAAIRETARRTDRRIELDEDTKAQLNDRLQILLQYLPGSPDVTITYFHPDDRKSGGAYLDVVGSVKRIDAYEQCIVMRDGKKIPLHDIISVESELFRSLDAE